MSTNYHRRYYAGTTVPAAVPAASRQNVRTASRARALASAARDGSPLPSNVVELYPSAAPCGRPGAGHRVRLTGTEAGMATAEYAIATLAAVGLAGLLVFILRSDEVRGFLLTLIRTALALP
jgi:hypothetical protein